MQALAPYRFGIPAGEVFRLFTRLHLMPHVFLPPDRFLSSQRWASLFNRPLQNARFLSGNGRRLSGGVQRPVAQRRHRLIQHVDLLLRRLLISAHPLTRPTVEVFTGIVPLRTIFITRPLDDIPSLPGHQSV
ncbi:hypothetical protein ACUN6B_14340 [Serratia sp. IR-2025]